MDEAQRGRVQTLSGEARNLFLCAVHRVAEDGVADVGHMDADLVRASGFQPAADVRIARIAGDDLPVRDSLASAGYHSHALAVRRMAGDRGVDSAAVLAEITDNDTFIRPCKRVIGELRGEKLVRRIVFRRDDQAARVAVDAVDDAGAQRSADAGERAGAVIKQCVDKRAVRMPRCGVDNHAAGLIDNDHICVLVYHVERDILRHSLDRLRLGKRYSDLLAACEPAAFA